LKVIPVIIIDSGAGLAKYYLLDFPSVYLSFCIPLFESLEDDFTHPWVSEIRYRCFLIEGIGILS